MLVKAFLWFGARGPWKVPCERLDAEQKHRRDSDLTLGATLPRILHALSIKRPPVVAGAESSHISVYEDYRLTTQSCVRIIDALTDIPRRLGAPPSCRPTPPPSSAADIRFASPFILALAVCTSPRSPHIFASTDTHTAFTHRTHCTPASPLADVLRLGFDHPSLSTTSSGSFLRRLHPSRHSFHSWRLDLASDVVAEETDQEVSREGAPRDSKEARDPRIGGQG